MPHVVPAQRDAKLLAERLEMPKFAAFCFRHCFAAAEGRDDLEAEDLIDDAAAPATDTL
jgi:hypothetical protein